MALMYVFETYLDWRQHKALNLPTLPKPLVGVVSQEKFEKSRAYSNDKSHFRFIHEAVTILTDTSILYFGILPWFWKKSAEFLIFMGLNAENEIMHTLAFLAGVLVWSQITNLPFSLYSTFVIEARHGFNKQTIGLFFWDMFKGILLSVLIGPPMLIKASAKFLLSVLDIFTPGSCFVCNYCANTCCLSLLPNTTFWVRSAGFVLIHFYCCLVCCWRY